MEGNYIPLERLDVYMQAREYGRIAWEIYAKLDWQLKKIIGDQMITSVDSVAANIAEGYGRYHYLDKNKFYYNGRGSLFESKHWFDVLLERKIIVIETYEKAFECYKKIEVKLNTLIRTTRNLSVTVH